MFILFEGASKIKSESHSPLMVHNTLHNYLKGKGVRLLIYIYLDFRH